VTEKRLVSEADIRELLIEAVKKAKIEALELAVKIQQDSFSIGSFRVAIYNQIADLTGKPRA
jgi:hypothetical protein